ncbi:glycosyltransferase family 4 protein [uncultured Winogradskyella sp.]|uniref:glycosyltransferase family 4 protein n=1 Tax=uncultured Winogradskyella sp. TaxID=395353 RepID=UPI003514F6CD
MNSFKKVLFVAPNHNNRKGGIASVLKTYSVEIEDFNFFPSIFFTSMLLNTVLFPINLISFCAYLIFIRRIKIIHIHGASKGSFYRKYIFFLLSKLFKKKVIYHIHGGKFHIFYSSSFYFIKTRIRRFINQCDALVVLSEEWKDYYTKSFEQKKIFVVKNMIKNVEPKTKHNDSNGIVNLLFLGKIGVNKGIFDLIDSIKLNKKNLEGKIKLTVGGDGEADQLKQLIVKHNLTGIVNYVGWVNEERKTKLLSNSHIMILPSYNEGLPISLLEGMSYSMPIISTKVGGIPQILKDSFNGKFVQPGNTNEIFEAIKFYIENKPLILEHGQKSYQLVQDYFPDKVMSSLEDIYQSM